MFNFDNQLLRDYAKCEAAGIARHVHGLKGKGEKVAADVGNAYHAALELHFAGRAKREVVERFMERYDLIVPPGEQPKEDRFARGNCVKIMERFCDMRPVEKFPFEPVEMEKVKGIPITEDGQWVFWVKRDMLVRMKAGDQLAPVDHKSTHRLTDWWARKYRMSSQISGYCWFTGKEYGQSVTGAYVNGIEVAKLPDSQKKCPLHGVRYAECGPEHANFQLYQYVRSPEQLEKWRQDALVIARKAALLSVAFGDIQLLPYALKQGAFSEECMLCEFSDWCAVGFDPKLAEEYTVWERWEPWAEGEMIEVKRG